MSRSVPRFEWRERPKPPRSILARAGDWITTFGGLVESPQLQLSSAGSLIPRTVGAKTAKEDALGLLQLAAEVEHALMAQYLYAAWSIVPGEDAASPSATAAKALSRIAIQEMFHLLGVQNLLIALGGPLAIHLGRDSLRTSSEFNPLPFLLEGVDHASLAKYIVAEMPARIDDEALDARVQKLRLEAKGDAGVQLDHVGAIYSALQWLFQEGDADMEPLGLGLKDGFEAGWHLAKDDLQAPELIEQFAAQRQPWHASEVSRKLLVVKTLDDGLAIIREISEQGEGVGPGDDSHFEQFIKLLDLFEQGVLDVLDVPKSPFASYPPPADVKERTEVQDPYTRMWCDWFDIRYTMLWHDIGHALSTPTPQAIRRKLTNMVFSQMQPGLKGLALALSSLPLGAPHQGHAAPGFGMVLPRLPEPGGFKQGALDLAAMEADVAQRIKADPAFPGSEAAASAYNRIMGADGLHDRRNALIEQT